MNDVTPSEPGLPHGHFTVAVSSHSRRDDVVVYFIESESFIFHLSRRVAAPHCFLMACFLAGGQSDVSVCTRGKATAPFVLVFNENSRPNER